MSFQIKLNNVIYQITQDVQMKRFFNVYFKDSYQRIVKDDSGNWHYAELRDLEKKIDPIPLQSLGEAIEQHLNS